MENSLVWGMEWIIFLQDLGGPFLKSLMEVVTFTGEEMFYLLLVPIIFWAFDHQAGARVGFAFLISAYVNPILKDLFPQPRPYEINSQVSDHTVPGSGMPSGHAQSSVFVWGVLAAQIGRKWVWALAIIFMFLVGFSRVYLGVHFPHQVVAGWLVGAFLLALFLAIDPRFEAWMGRLTLGSQLAITTTVPVALAIIYQHNDTVAAAAVMGGIGSGLVITNHYIHFSARGLWWQRLVRAVIGLAGLLILYLGLSAIAPGEGEVNEMVYYLTRFLRYGLMGLWISLGAPWLFRILHLSEISEPALKPREASG